MVSCQSSLRCQLRSISTNLHGLAPSTTIAPGTPALRVSQVSDSSAIHSCHADSELVCFFLSWNTEKSSIKKSAWLHPDVTQLRPYKAELSWKSSGWSHADYSALVPRSLECPGEQCYLKQGKGFLIPSLISTWLLIPAHTSSSSIWVGENQLLRSCLFSSISQKQW